MIQPLTMHNIRTIDTAILNQLKTHGASIHSIFTHTLNLIVNDTLITLAHDVSEGKHHVIIEHPINFKQLPLSKTDDVHLLEEALLIGGEMFSLQNTDVKKYLPYTQTFLVNKSHHSLALELEKHLKDSDKPNIYQKTHKTSLGKTFNDHIKHFIKDPSNDPTHIVGLGIGLTPLGDDFLLGYMLVHQALKNPLYSPKDICKIKAQTNLISLQSLTDVMHYHYTHQLIGFLEDFFIHYSLKSALEILDYGASSGAGILSGFIEGLKSWEG